MLALLIGFPFASIATTLEEHRFTQTLVLFGSLLTLALLGRMSRRPIQP